MTGIAAGSGRASRGTYSGCAPGASIIFVNTGSSNYIFGDSAEVADAFSYVFARAGSGVPCVVNMSQSDNMGPHDGSTLGERFLDSLLITPGRAVTLSAGNANNKGSYIKGKVQDGGTTIVTVAYATDAGRSDTIEIWYDGHDRFDTTLMIPSASKANPRAVTTVIGPVIPGTMSPPTELDNGVEVQVVHGYQDARNNDNVITIFVTRVSSAHPIPPGDWEIKLSGASVINGAFDGWIDRNNRGKRRWRGAVEDEGTIAVPASSRRAISVGNHDESRPLPKIHRSSSCGPTRDGRVKPDIATIGTDVIAPWNQEINHPVPGGFYRSITGTSMAAPTIAGAVALMFQCRRRGLSSSDIKQILQDSAGDPAAVMPSNSFGFGFLQAAGICPYSPDVDIWLRSHSSDSGVEPFTGSVSWLSPDIEVLDMVGNVVSNPTHDPTNSVNNLVRVTVRNRGAVTARNIEVYLYWADPATNIPFPSEWQRAGIYTGDPNFVIESNKVVIPQLDAGATTSVRYAWAPPAPGSNILGDDHFCLTVRLEQEDDPSNISAGGWATIKGSNNVALRNTRVQEVPGGRGDASAGFFVNGSDDVDSLEIESHNLSGRIELQFPVQAMPWRDLSLANEYGKPRRPYSPEEASDPLLDWNTVIQESEVGLFTGFRGVEEIRFALGTAHVISDAETAMFLPRIRVQQGVKMPARLIAHGVQVERGNGFVHVRQRSGDKTIGGVSLQVVRRLKRGKKHRTFLDHGKLVIQFPGQE